VIVEFGDYECPYCRSAHGILRSLRQVFPEDLAIVYRHYPLEAIHPQAYYAARLAECGAQQAAFEATHNYLFEHDVHDTIDVSGLVAAVGISNRQHFTECANSTHSVLAIEEDRGSADVLGIARTPSFIVQGMLLSTTPDSTGWSQLIATHINDKRGSR
jgi:protein-disulfide isomerase